MGRSQETWNKKETEKKKKSVKKNARQMPEKTIV